MVKKSAAAGSGKRRGRPPSAEGRRSFAVRVKGRPEWRDWVIRFAERERCDAAVLVDVALTSLAEARGFEGPPKR